MGESLSALYLRDPESAAILRRQAMAQQLARAQNDPIMYRSAASPWVAGLQALAGNLGAVMAERDLGALNERRDGEANEWRRNAMAGLLSGQGTPPAAPASPTPSAAPARMGGAAIPSPGGVRTGAAVPVPDALDDADILARTLIGEAGNQGEEGMRAVGFTARNRMQQTGRSVRDVVLAPYQYEPWQTRRDELLAIPTTDPRYIVARNIAQSVLDGAVPDPTNGATHFLNPDLQRQLGRQQPAWAPEGQGQRIGAHVFYRPGGGIRTGAEQNAPPASAPDGIATPASAPGQPAAPQVPGAPAGMTREALIPMIMDGMNSRNPRIREEAQRMAQVAQLLPQPSQRTFTTAAPGSALVDNQGRVVGQIPQQPAETERLLDTYGRLVELGENVTPAQRAQRDALAARLRGAPPQIGSIPPGFQVTQQPDGSFAMRPIPGGPAERQEREAARAEAARQTGTQRTGNVVLQDLDRTISLLDSARLPVAGFAASSLSQIPGTAAADAARLLDSVRANVGFAQLNQMRAESPTGGALGQVTERELQFLQAVLGSLDQTQSPAQFRQNLARVRNVFLDIVHGPGQGPPRVATGMEQPGQPPAGARPNDAAAASPAPQGIQADPPVNAAPVRVRTPEEARRLPSGTPIILPDGSRGRVP